MGKDKKKKHAKKDQVSEDLLDAAVLSLKKFRKVTRQIGKLSTGQKVVGGLALAAAGLAYLAQRQPETGKPSASTPDAPLLLGAGHRSAAPDEEQAAVDTPAPKKSRKSSRAQL